MHGIQTHVTVVWQIGQQYGDEVLLIFYWSLPP